MLIVRRSTNPHGALSGRATPSHAGGFDAGGTFRPLTGKLQLSPFRPAAWRAPACASPIPNMASDPPAAGPLPGADLRIALTTAKARAMVSWSEVQRRLLPASRNRNECGAEASPRRRRRLEREAAPHAPTCHPCSQTAASVNRSSVPPVHGPCHRPCRQGSHGTPRRTLSHSRPSSPAPRLAARAIARLGQRMRRCSRCRSCPKRPVRRSGFVSFIPISH